MKSISTILKNLGNLVPYFLLIAIYFFFVNLEARKDNNSYNDSEFENLLSDDNSNLNVNELRIKIPVIPYDQ